MTNNTAKAFHGNLGIEYYVYAIDYFKAFGIKNYVIFTDDINLANKFLAPINFEYSCYLGADPRTSMIELSKYQNIIIANSSFSWWAARIADQNKTVVAPAQWVTKKACEQLQISDFSHLLPNEWIKISC